MERYDDVVTLGEIVSATKAKDVDWHYHDPDEGIGAEMLAYNDMGLTVCGVVRIVCDNPRLAFARALSLYDEPTLYPLGASWVCSGTMFGGGMPGEIGQGSVIGGPGFGYERDEKGEPIRIKHLGRVILGDKVVIHSNVCIDRGVIGDTIIGEGTKIDNLTHIAHNVKIGKNNTIAASSSIEGSVVIGDNNTFGSNVTVLRKVKIGSGCTIGSGAVVTKDVPDGQVWVGNPARQLTKN